MSATRYECIAEMWDGQYCGKPCSPLSSQYCDPHRRAIARQNLENGKRTLNFGNQSRG